MRADIVFTDRIAPGMLLKGLQTHCGRTPYFDHYFPEIEAWAHAHLLPGNAWLDAAIASTQWACEAMGFAHPERSSAYIDGTLPRRLATQIKVATRRHRPLSSGV